MALVCLLGSLLVGGVGALTNVNVDVQTRLARPMPKGTPLQRYPAKDLCSRCGLCDTSLISRVKDACAFIGRGQSRLVDMEAAVHGRSRDEADEEEVYFGVGAETLEYVKMQRQWRPADAAWTGVVTSIAAAALEAGLVDAVLGVGSEDSSKPHLRMRPKPVLCRTAAEVFAQCAGVKPTLSPTLELLDAVRNDPSIKRLMFLGVGCQVQALRAVEQDLGLEELYVVGTNCADNVRSGEALQRFMEAVSTTPETAVGFEFMQDYKVHVKHVGGRYEKVPVFVLPSEQLKDVIAESCYSCFDYSNALADVVVGYMATPDEGVEMTEHSQYVVTRNENGKKLLDLIRSKATFSKDVQSRGKRVGFAKQVTEQDLTTLFLGAKPRIWALPLWIANLASKVLGRVGPAGVEFAKNSIDYHQLRNAIHVRVKHGDARGEEHVPSYARTIEQKHYPGFTDELVERYRTEVQTRADDAAPRR